MLCLRLLPTPPESPGAKRSAGERGLDRRRKRRERRTPGVIQEACLGKGGWGNCAAACSLSVTSEFRLSAELISYLGRQGDSASRWFVWRPTSSNPSAKELYEP